VGARGARASHRSELDRRIGRRLDDEALKKLAALGVIEQLPDGTVLLLGPGSLGAAADLSAMPLDTLIAAHESIERHTSELAVELQRVFQDTVVRPYRERGRPPEERDALLELAVKLKPLMIQSLVESFQRAVDRAIRQSASRD